MVLTVANPWNLNDKILVPRMDGNKEKCGVWVKTPGSVYLNLEGCGGSSSFGYLLL